MLLEKQIRSQPLGLRRIDVPSPVPEGEAAAGRPAVEIFNGQPDRDGGADVEEDGHIAAEAQVLTPLADVEAQGRLAFARLAAVEERDSIFQLQAAEPGGHGLAGEDLHCQEAVPVPARVLVFGELSLILAAHAERCHAAVNRSRLWALDAQRLRDGAVVDDLDQDRGKAGLLEDRPGRTARRLDARFRIQRNDHEDMRVEQFLELAGVTPIGRRLQCRGSLRRQRRPQVRQGLDQPLDIGRQGLACDIDGGRLLSPGRRHGQAGQYQAANNDPTKRQLPVNSHGCQIGFKCCASSISSQAKNRSRLVFAEPFPDPVATASRSG